MAEVKSIVDRHHKATYAIKFEPGSEEAGTYLVMLHGPGVGLSGGIFLVKSTLVDILEKEGLGFKMERVSTSDLSKVRQELVDKGWQLAAV